jgi:endonuclease YncB( thermonuclease family)
MRNEIIFISILRALLLQPLVLAVPGEAYGNVTYVVDGDTFYVQIQGYDNRIGNISVRLDDVDSPEMNTSEGKDSRNYTFEKLNGSFVSLDLDDVTGKDRYCRWVAVVFFQDQYGTWVNFNKMLVESGHASIWDFCNNEFDPHTWWNGTYPSNASIKCCQGINYPGACSDGSLVGSTSSRKYHYYHYYHYFCCLKVRKIIPANLIKFNSSQDARNQGYVSCKECCPP